MTTTETPTLQSMIPLDLVDEHPDNLRTVFDEDRLDELAQSIASVGLINPITVVTNGTGRFTVVAGHRRLRAYRKAIPSATTIPAIMSDALNFQQVTTMMLVENLQRADISPVEEARGYLRLVAEFKIKPKALAKMVGRSQQHISERLALLTLPDEVQAVVGDALPIGLAVKLSQIVDDKTRKGLFADAKKGRLRDYQVDNALRSERHRREAELLKTQVDKLGITCLAKIADSGIAWAKLETVGDFDHKSFAGHVYDPSNIYVLNGPRLWVYRELSDDEAEKRQSDRKVGLRPGDERTPWHDWSERKAAYDDAVSDWEEQCAAEWRVLLQGMSAKQLQTAALEYLMAQVAGRSAARLGGSFTPAWKVAEMLQLDLSDMQAEAAVAAYMTDMATVLHVYILGRVIAGAAEDSGGLYAQYEQHLAAIGLTDPPAMPADVEIEPWQNADGAWITDQPEPEDNVSPDDHLESAYEDLSHLEDDDDGSDYDFEYEGEPPVDYD